MSARDTILLIVKQNEGIDYHEILSKIQGNYSNINSARAALSRTLKDLSARRIIARKKNRVFTTDRGRALIGKRMKSKLIIKLNDSVLHNVGAKNVESIVQILSTTIQRSEEDKDLLNIARNSVSFYISDLESIQKDLDKKTKQLEFMKGVFEKQVRTLKDLNFNDSFGMNWSKEAKEKTIQIAKSVKAKEIFVESNSETLIGILAENLQGKKKGSDVFFEKSKLPELLGDIEKEIERIESLRLTFFIGEFKIQLKERVLAFSGPFKKLERFKN